MILTIEKSSAGNKLNSSWEINMVKYLALGFVFALSSPAYTEEKDISFFDPNDWFRLECRDIETPAQSYLTVNIAVRKDLTAVYYNYDDRLLDDCNREKFDLNCSKDGESLTIFINRITGYMDIYDHSTRKIYACKKLEMVF